MPSFNQTYPMEHSAMTGRRMGRCVHVEENSNNQTSKSNERANEKINEYHVWKREESTE